MTTATRIASLLLSLQGGLRHTQLLRGRGKARTARHGSASSKSGKYNKKAQPNDAVDLAAPGVRFEKLSSLCDALADGSYDVSASKIAYKLLYYGNLPVEMSGTISFGSAAPAKKPGAAAREHASERISWGKN